MREAALQRFGEQAWTVFAGQFQPVENIAADAEGQRYGRGKDHAHLAAQVDDVHGFFEDVEAIKKHFAGLRADIGQVVQAVEHA